MDKQIIRPSIETYGKTIGKRTLKEIVSMAHQPANYRKLKAMVAFKLMGIWYIQPVRKHGQNGKILYYNKGTLVARSHMVRL